MQKIKTVVIHEGPIGPVGDQGAQGPQGAPGAGVHDLVGNDDLAFAVVDQDGRRSWLEAAPDGAPSDHAATAMAQAVAPVIQSGGLLPGLMAEMSDASGYAFAITDDQDRIALGIRPDGSTTLGASPPAAPRRGTLPITGWGTSMMQGGTGAGTTLLTVLADELGLTAADVLNRGGSGMRSPGIAAQQGAAPVMLTVTSGVIPASGGVAVRTTDQVDTFYYWGASPSASQVGTLMGVPGTVTMAVNVVTDTDDATFTRSAAGDAITITGARPFLPNAGPQTWGNCTIVWAARNDMDQPDQALANIAAMVGALTHDDYLVLSELNGPDVETFNARLAAQHPYAFVDLKAWLIQYGLSYLGLTPTAQDATDIAAGTVPTTLRADSIHLNATGYQAAGHYVAQIITEKGWL